MEDFVRKWLFDPVIGRLVTVAIGVIVVVVVVRILHRTLGRYVRDTDTRYRARKFITFSGYILAALVIVTVYSSRLAGLHVAFGVVGAGIAFALQEVIVSVAGWFAVMFSGFYKTGDRVQLGGIKGDVIDIGILRTTLMEVGQWVQGDLYNGRVVRVANSFVFKEPVFNYSGEFPFLWDEITLPIRYGSDYRYTQQIIQRAAEELVGDYAGFAEEAWETLVRKYRIEDARVTPMVSLTADANWMTFTLRYVVDYKKRRTTKDELFFRVVEEIEKTNGRVRIASAAMEITMLEPAVPSSNTDII
ncbi:mechanosensitive ion channel family protein [bacterium]|nr:mechanosensitive ion channel family protein [bacterium]MBU1983229.1 mechanosensitive ion channel family protein [bacterium]